MRSTEGLFVNPKYKSSEQAPGLELAYSREAL
jgi:hypothetical protein